MDYYRTLHLDREPFSNSPDPGLFFNSKQHLEALQKLEISIRLKRGLNVITGDVGTGKTTLSRQLIQKISFDPVLKYFLILDPGFSSTTDFLQCILSLFTGRPPDKNTDDTALKEQIKDYLFAQGVDQGTTTILMIDEGQKLPVFCLEVLRELLNYETNEHKLLQIIIFAQKEFNTAIQALDNFNDRINFRYTLSPLGFSETRQLIWFRLQQSGSSTARPPFFTFCAFLAIYRYTRGYPRKIINLCHHVMIRLIIKNLQKADYFFVASCAREVFPSARPRPFRLATSTLVILLLLGGAVLLNGDQFSGLVAGKKANTPAVENAATAVTTFTAVTKEISEAPAQDTVPAVPPPVQAPETSLAVIDDPATDPGPVISLPEETDPPPAFEPEMPAVYGTLQVPRNETLYRMLALVYGSFKKGYAAELLAVNPQITNPDLIRTGMDIVFPVITETTRDWEKAAACICLAQETAFDTAFQTARRFRNTGLDVRILPGWDPGTGFSYTVVVNQVFDTPALAAAYRDSRENLSQGMCDTIETCTRGRL